MCLSYLWWFCWVGVLPLLAPLSSKGVYCGNSAQINWTVLVFFVDLHLLCSSGLVCWSCTVLPSSLFVVSPLTAVSWVYSGSQGICPSVFVRSMASGRCPCQLKHGSLVVNGSVALQALRRCCIPRCGVRSNIVAPIWASISFLLLLFLFKCPTSNESSAKKPLLSLLSMFPCT